MWVGLGRAEVVWVGLGRGPTQGCGNPALISGDPVIDAIVTSKTPSYLRIPLINGSLLFGGPSSSSLMSF